MSDKRVALIGCHFVGELLLRQLLAAGVSIDAVIGLSPESAQRYSVSGYANLNEVGRELGVETFQVNRFALDHDDDLAFFDSQRFSVLIGAGWMRLLPLAVLDTLGIGAIGVHGSADPLPKGRGRSPLNWELIRGSSRFLLHAFLMRAGADDGDVLDREAFDITHRDTIRTLYLKNAIATRRMLLRTLPKLLDGSAQALPQVGVPSYFPKRSPADGAIDWQEHDIQHIDRLVRASTRPYPGAFASLNGRVQTIWDGFVFDTRLMYDNADYGDVVERFDELQIVKARGGLYAISESEPRNA